MWLLTELAIQPMWHMLATLADLKAARCASCLTVDFTVFIEIFFFVIDTGRNNVMCVEQFCHMSSECQSHQ